MKRPATIVYGVDDKPPAPVVFFGALQHVVLIAIRLVFPLLVAREAGLSDAAVLDVVSLSMIVMGIAVVLQALPRGVVGAGYLCPASFTSAYIAPSMLAAKAGGIALVGGMTLFGGLVECVMSRLVRPLRPYFPPEIAGLVVVVVGVTLGALGTRNVLGVGTPQGTTIAGLAVVGVTLAATIVLNIWGKGAWRVFSPLIGMAIGYVAAAVAGILTMRELAPVVAAPVFHVPSFSHLGYSFESSLVVPFAIAAVAASLRAIGDVTTCQKINDAEWTRPDMKSVAGGVLANGLATASGGLLGSLGVNTLTSGVGLSSATGLTSRAVAFAIGGMFAALAFLPKVGALLAVMPAPVLGAVLWFSAAFVLVNGVQIVTSRMFDTRRTLVFGLSFTIALGVDLYPSVFAGAPAAIAPFTGSSLVLGTVVALALNAVFRLGVRRVQTLAIDPREIDGAKLAEFMQKQGATWGARREVIERATFNLRQSIETIAGTVRPTGPITVDASFDEFRLDVRVAYEGLALELPETRPTDDEILESLAGERKLAGYMLRRLADRVSMSSRGGKSVILFQFDH